MLCDAVKDFILGELGFPQVDVELSDFQIATAYERAIDKYLYYRNTDTAVYYFETGDADLLTDDPENTGDQPEKRNNGYAIPKPILDNMFGVVISSLVPLTGFTGLGDGSYYFSLLMNSIYINKRSKETYLTDYALTLNFETTIGKLLGTQISYEILNNKLYLYPAPADPRIKVGVKYLTPPSQVELQNNVWIKKYALAHAKVTLGTIRRKFGNIPNGTTTIQTDGDALINDGRTEMEKHFEELKSLAQPPLPEIY